jgi:hypothetical protein
MAIGLVPLAFFAGVIVYGCGAASHAANVAESAQYAAELAGCRRSGRRCR